MIKKGDLVMVVKPTPCCGNTARVGQIFISQGHAVSNRCLWCSHAGEHLCVAGDGFFVNEKRLRKIDPPAEGETREAYVNIKQPRKVTA